MVMDAAGDAPATLAEMTQAAVAQAQQEHEQEKGEEKTKKPTPGRLMRRLTGVAISLLARGLDCFDIFIKILGPIFMLLALGMFSFETYTYFAFVLPTLGEDGMPFPLQVSLSVLGVFLLANLMYNYLMAVLVDPGMPPEWDSETLLEHGQKDDRVEEGVPRRRARKCGKCSREKVERSHHCSVCKRCVLKMDHHCPWINNCVGYCNYRYFCLFLTYLALCCFFVMVVFFGPFVDTMMSPSRRRTNMDAYRHQRLSFGARQCVSLCFIIAACIFCALLLLGGFHVYLVLTNQTTIEFHMNLGNKDKARRKGEFFRNPYDLGRPRNFKQVFGPNDFCTFRWALSFVGQPPIGDGMSFPNTQLTNH